MFHATYFKILFCVPNYFPANLATGSSRLTTSVIFLYTVFPQKKVATGVGYKTSRRAGPHVLTTCLKSSATHTAPSTRGVARGAAHGDSAPQNPSNPIIQTCMLNPALPSTPQVMSQLPQHPFPLKDSRLCHCAALLTLTFCNQSHKCCFVWLKSCHKMVDT